MGTTFYVNTPMVKVFKSSDGPEGYQMHITCKDGSIVEHEPFQNNLEGLVAAISLSAEICAGKFYLSGIFLNKQKLKQIAHKEE